MPLKIANEIPPCDDDIPEPVDTGSSSDDTIPLLNFSNCPVTESEILDAISMLLPKKTEDFNGVSLFFLKNSKIILLNPFVISLIVHSSLLCRLSLKLRK
jgi:hypothetical protein